MSKYYAVDSIREAIDETIAFFKGPGLLKKWLKIAILLTIINLLSGGGANFKVELPCKDCEAVDLSAITTQIASIPSETILIIGLIIVLALFIIGFILTLIKNMCFFSVLESISINNVRIIPYLKKFFSLAFSLALFEIILGIIFIPVTIAWLIVIAGLLILIFSRFMPITAILGNSPLVQQAVAFVTNPVILIVAASIALIGTVILLIIYYIKDQFAVYLMYRENRKAWPSFLKGFALVKRNLMQVFVLILIQIVLVIVAVMIGLIVGLIIAIPIILIVISSAIISVILIGISALFIIPIILIAIIAGLIVVYVLNVILAPVGVFFYYFNLAVLGKFLAGAKPAQTFASKAIMKTKK